MLSYSIAIFLLSRVINYLYNFFRVCFVDKISNLQEFFSALAIELVLFIVTVLEQSLLLREDVVDLLLRDDCKFSFYRKCVGDVFAVVRLVVTKC